jgi:hypothetical protein
MTILFNRTACLAFNIFGIKKPDCEGSLARGNLAIRDYFPLENVVQVFFIFMKCLDYIS